MKFTVGINLQAAEEYHAELKPRVAKSAFLSACNSWKPVLPGGGKADGLDDPIYRHTVGGVKARLNAEELYTKIIDRARAKRDERVAQLALQKEAEQKKLARLQRRARPTYSLT